MKNIKKLVAVAILTATISSFVACGTVSKSPEAIAKTVAASINGEDITIADIDTLLEAGIKSLEEEFGEDFESKIDEQTKSELSQARKSALDELILEKIMLKKAADLKLVPNQEDLDKRVSEEIKGLVEVYGSEEKLNEAKEYFGYTDETFKTYIQNNIIKEILILDATKDISITDEDISSFYNENIKLFTKTPGADTKHILFEDEATALEAIKKIESGEKNFDTLFEEYTANKLQGLKPLSEDLGFVSYDDEKYDKDFLAGLKDVKENQISAPIKTSFGFHIIKASKLQADTKVTPLEEVKDDIKVEVESSKKYEHFSTVLDSWKSEFEIKDFSDKTL